MSTSIRIVLERQTLFRGEPNRVGVLSPSPSPDAEPAADAFVLLAWLSRSDAVVELEFDDVAVGGRLPLPAKLEAIEIGRGASVLGVDGTDGWDFSVLRPPPIDKPNQPFCPSFSYRGARYSEVKW